MIGATKDLVGITKYERPALREKAPEVADCLTSIHYLFKKALGTEIPVEFIGDVPRHMMFLNEWKALKVSIEEVRCGDILFVRNKDNARELSHIAVVLKADKIFHCSPASKTAVIESWEEFFAAYEQKLNFKNMIRYIDPRNKPLREEQQGAFITD